MPGVRYVGGGDMTELSGIALESVRIEQALLAKQGHTGMAQVFVYPASIRIKEQGAAAGFDRERRLYVIRNARLDPDWAHVERSTMSIAGRAVASLIHTQGIGDLYRIYATAQRDGVDFNLTFIPSTFNVPHKEEFDNEYMRKLYDVGYDLAVKGMKWAKVPPGFDSSAGDVSIIAAP